MASVLTSGTAVQDFSGDAAVPAGTGYPYVWSQTRKVLFRIAFVFFIIMCLPAPGGWYNTVLHINWAHLHYRDLYDVARFSPIKVWSVAGDSGRWGFWSWANWWGILGVSIPIALVWGLIDRKRREYNLAYYWLLAIVRYRAAIGIIGFGFTKLLPVQMPYPSVSLLNNNFGDITGHKVFWLSIGIVPWYQVFTGIVEVTAGTLLFFRKTAALGASLLIGALLSITVVNLGYDGGVHVYASYFVLLGAFVLSYYIPRFYKLLIKQQYTVPVDIVPAFAKSRFRWVRIGVKSLVIFVFLGVLFYLQFVNFLYDPYKQPSTPGVKALRGYYTVTDFKLNGQSLPYDPTDTTRWQEVTLEKWSTLTYRQLRKVPLELSNGGGGPMKDINKSFEVSGVAGGRRVFQYFADTIEHVLYLQDKNITTAKKYKKGGNEDDDIRKEYLVKDSSQFWIPLYALRHIGDENTKINPLASSARRNRVFARGLVDEGRNKMILHYTVL
ncbi:MAG TPA: hypothetical protein VGC22_07510, partial [Chitinophaga sp.]